MNLLLAKAKLALRIMTTDFDSEITDLILAALKDLLDRLKRGYEEIIEQIYTITDPVWGLRGKYAMPINPNVMAPYHGLNGMQGYNRSYASGFAAGHPQYIGRGGRW